MLYQLSYQAPWEQGGGKKGIQVLDFFLVPITSEEASYMIIPVEGDDNIATDYNNIMQGCFIREASSEYPVLHVENVDAR